MSFNNSLSLGIFLENLKIACLCPIYKGEGTRSNPDNYRPISVLPVLSRIFEKLIQEQLYAFIELHLHSFQSGFRQKHSTRIFLLETTNNWFLNIDKGEYNIAVFLDLGKAFDTVNHEVMLYKLFLYGIRGIELKWFSSYLQNRQQFCAYKNVKSDYRNGYLWYIPRIMSWPLTLSDIC